MVGAEAELMLMGFIAFLLSAFQGPLNRICIPSSFFDHMLPCRRKEFEDHKSENQCEKKGKEQLLSIDAIHQLHIFIFVLAITHLALTVVTIFLGRLKIRQWKAWENSIAKDADNSRSKIIHVLSDQFITEHYKAIKGHSCVLSWLHSFFKHFHASITKTGYRTLRSGFIMMHCEGNPQYDFHKYIMRAYEDDFKKVVGISWYHWPFVVVLLLMNVGGELLKLLLAVGTKLEHVISQLAKEVVEKHTAMEGELVVSLSDRHFWFKKPRLVLHLIHFILLQNAFQIAFFFWLWV
ncbi:MLO-like protein 1 [Nymphaea thermarum]|nr:MLO-like protein 1 [Nymphaea thermarum]